MCRITYFTIIVANFEKSIYTGANIMWSLNTSNWIKIQFNSKFGGKKSKKIDL